MNQFLENHYIGRAAEYRVVSELLLRGHRPAQLAFDDGVDILLVNGTRIQVRTARLSNEQKIKGCPDTYICNLKGGRRRDRKLRSEDVDIVVFWLVGTNDFYIFPMSRLPDKWRIHIPADLNQGNPSRTYARVKYEEFKNLWSAFETS